MDIEKGIPLQRRKYIKPETLVLLQKMVPGDSLFIDSSMSIGGVRMRLRSLNIPFASKKEKDGYRIWRM